MRLFGWFRKKPVKEAVPPPVMLRERPAQLGTLEHAQTRLAGQLRARDKWQAIVDAGQGSGRKTHEECVATLKAVADRPYDGHANKIEYWRARVIEAELTQSRAEVSSSDS